ncbi:MAG: RlmE family RNA methyltransferase [bacterium]
MSPVYERKDHYYKKAKEEGLASRAVYKLEEIDKQFRLIPAAGKILDLGCAPGGWLQFLGKKVGTQGKVVGVDLLPVQAKFPPHVKVLRGDATQPEIQEICRKELDGPAHAVVSDMSPNLSGIRFRDNFESYQLALTVLKVARSFLREGGSMLVKIFPGDELNDYKKQLQESFSEIKTFIPKATRKGSSEIYLIAKGFHLAKAAAFKPA